MEYLFGAQHLSNAFSEAPTAVIDAIEGGRVLHWAGTLTSVIDLVDNAGQWWEDPNWEDFGQMVLDGVVIVGYANPETGVFIAIGVTAWEQYEAYRDSHP